MTVATELCRSVHDWTGAETSFNTGYPADKATDVQVYFRAPDGTTTPLTPGINHTVSVVSIAGNKVAIVTPISIPGPSGKIVTLRVTPALVGEVLQDGEGFSLAIVQMLFDRDAMRGAEARRDAARSIVLPPADEIGAGAFNLLGTRMTNLAPGIQPSDAATVAQLQGIGAATGNVPPPVIGQINYVLKATGASSFAWVRNDVASVEGLADALDLRVRVDTAQALTEASRTQGRENIGVYGLPGSLRNRLLNGAMRISQRGTTFNANGLTLDRWGIEFSSGVGSVAHNPIVADDLSFSLLWSQTSGGVTPYLWQAIEGARTLAGQRICVSFSAAVISGGTTLTPRLTQIFGTGGAPSAPVSTVGTPIVLTGGRVFQFVQLPSIAGKTFGSNGDDCLRLDLIAASGATFQLSLTDIQLEEAAASGTGPAPFERLPIELERALCQRYFQAIPTPIEVSMGAASPAQMVTSRLLPVRMRAAPVVSVPVYPALANCTSFTVTATPDQYTATVTITGVAGQYGITGAGVLHFNAEL